MRPQRPPIVDPFESLAIHVGFGEHTPLVARRLKVLLLEDRNDFRSVLGEYLISCSHDVISVSSGVEGLGEIMKSRFDVIICDMMMPNMGGEMFYWAVTRVRPATRNHFIFFTGHKNNPPNEFFFKRVNATVIYKPFKLLLLDTVISEVLAKLGYVSERRTLTQS